MAKKPNPFRSRRFATRGISLRKVKLPRPYGLWARAVRNRPRD